MATQRLDLCDPGQRHAENFVSHHFADVIADEGADAAPSSPLLRGGQHNADRALADLDLAGYTRDRSQAYPERLRGSSRLSPYIRHGLLTLPRLWRHVQGPSAEVARFRLELLWQEYARHWYARLGSSTKRPLLNEPDGSPDPSATRAERVGPNQVGSTEDGPDVSWDQSMGCLEITTGELEDDGWLVGQTRLWLASHWVVRLGRDWRDGEEYFFTHLLDGSRAANRLGWQMATGMTANRPYHFTRLEVESRAPGLCASCELNTACPIEQWPDRSPSKPVSRPDPLLYADPNPERTSGSTRIERPKGNADRPDVVWITAESMGHDDPALAAHPDLPAVFVFDRPLLKRLRLSSKRLVFIVETLAELATSRDVHVYDGTPAEALAGSSVATTFAPVPGWRHHARRVEPVEIHPWPWLHWPGPGDLSTFQRWFEQVSGGQLDREPVGAAHSAISL